MNNPTPRWLSPVTFSWISQSDAAKQRTSGKPQGPSRRKPHPWPHPSGFSTVLFAPGQQVTVSKKGWAKTQGGQAWKWQTSILLPFIGWRSATWQHQCKGVEMEASGAQPLPQVGSLPKERRELRVHGSRHSLHPLHQAKAMAGSMMKASGARDWGGVDVGTRVISG